MWGSPYTNATSDTCTTCPSLNACKRAVATLAPVACEHPLSPVPVDGTGEGQGWGPAPFRPERRRPSSKTWTRRDYAAYLTPGEIFTVAELAARAGANPHAAATWCAVQVHAGTLQHAGKARSAGRNYAKLYRYQP
jgi:hypothetical protein